MKLSKKEKPIVTEEELALRARQDRLAMWCYMALSVVLELAYYVEVLKGNRTNGYFLLFSFFVIAPLLIYVILYFRNPSSVLLRHIYGYGYLIMYAFAMLTGSTNLVFVYIIPYSTIIMLFTDVTMTIRGVLGVFLINGITLYLRNKQTPFSAADITDAEIQIAVLALTATFLALVTNFMNKENQRKLAQIEQQRKLAEDAKKSKSDFLSNMSHEIRTPLNAIIGMNEMILRESEDADILSYAALSQSSSHALLSLINDILDLSKIEAGKIEIVPTQYEISSLFVDCYHMVADKAKEKSLKLTFQADPTLPRTLYGDVIRIRQVFINILTNAVKYTSVGGVSVSLMGERREKDYRLVFKVKDTGVGMQQEDLDKLFEKFERFDLKRNRSVEGTGLGMSITKQLLDLMGGEIFVESEYGAGSCFVVFLPQEIVNPMPIGLLDVNNYQEQQRQHKQTNSFFAPLARILVVDDVESNLEVVRDLLGGTKIQVDTCISGKKALALANMQEYDLIFLDHMMPDLDGVETLQRLMENPVFAAKKIPVIMLTANALSGEKERYLAQGFTDYLAKPVSVHLLEEMLLKYLPAEKVQR